MSITLSVIEICAGTLRCIIEVMVDSLRCGVASRVSRLNYVHLLRDGSYECVLTRHLFSLQNFLDPLSGKK